MVKTLNVTLDDHDHERAAAVKEELGLTWPEYIVEAADALEAREEDAIPTSSVSTTGERAGDRRDRGDTPGGASTQADREVDYAEGVASPESAASRATSIDELFTSWDPDWTSHVSERYGAGRAALEWLRDDRERPASADDFREALLPEYEIPGQSPETWWRTTVRPWLRKAVEHGLVRYRDGHHDYQWYET